jgi:antirestriction protein ArdC
MNGSFKPKTSIYEKVTSQIVAMIEVGTETYRAPWHVPAGMSCQQSVRAEDKQF